MKPAVLTSRNQVANSWHQLTDTGLFLFVFAACICKLWLSSIVPFSVPLFDPHDGTWFFLKAVSISEGNWLGDYDRYTLIKGPGYPVFLSLVNALGISIRNALDLLYVAACLTFLVSLRSVLTSATGLLAGFLLLLFNPITFSDFWSYPMRMNLYIPLIIFLLSGIVALCCLLIEEYFSWRKLIGWSLVAGVSLGYAWNTREESIWLVSALFPLCLISVRRLYLRSGVVAVVAMWILLIAIPVLVSSMFVHQSKQHYDYEGTVDFKAPEFAKALSAIMSLNTGSPRYHYLTLEVRDKLRDISPATRELVSKMVDESGLYRGKKFVPGSYGSWVVRSAMGKNGYYESVAKAELQYKKLASDIAQYCQQYPGRCNDNVFAGFIYRADSLSDLPIQAITGFRDLLEIARFSPADRADDRESGDLNFQYMVDRYFNFKSGYDANLERLTTLGPIEERRQELVDGLCALYKNYLWVLLVISLISATLFVAMKGLWKQKMIGLCLLSAFCAAFSVYLFISVFAVPNFTRLLASVYAPYLCFISFFLAAVIDLIARKMFGDNTSQSL